MLNDADVESIKEHDVEGVISFEKTLLHCVRIMKGIYRDTEDKPDIIDPSTFRYVCFSLKTLKMIEAEKREHARVKEEMKKIVDALVEVSKPYEPAPSKGKKEPECASLGAVLPVKVPDGCSASLETIAEEEEGVGTCFRKKS